jgi:hypothetical protein
VTHNQDCKLPNTLHYLAKQTWPCNRKVTAHKSVVNSRHLFMFPRMMASLSHDRHVCYIVLPTQPTPPQYADPTPNTTPQILATQPKSTNWIRTNPLLHRHPMRQRGQHLHPRPPLASNADCAIHNDSIAASVENCVDVHLGDTESTSYACVYAIITCPRGATQGAQFLSSNTPFHVAHDILTYPPLHLNSVHRTLCTETHVAKTIFFKLVLYCLLSNHPYLS